MTQSEQKAMEIVENLKATPIKCWQSQYTTWIVGRSLSPSVNRVLKSWGVFTQDERNQSGNYTVNYNAPVFN